MWLSICHKLESFWSNLYFVFYLFSSILDNKGLLHSWWSPALASPLLVSIFPRGGCRQWWSEAGALQVVAATTIWSLKIVFLSMFSVGKSSLFSFPVSKRTRLNLVVMLLSEPVPSKRLCFHKWHSFNCESSTPEILASQHPAGEWSVWMRISDLFTYKEKG